MKVRTKKHAPSQTATLQCPKRKVQRVLSTNSIHLGTTPIEALAELAEKETMSLSLSHSDPRSTTNPESSILQGKMIIMSQSHSIRKDLRSILNLNLNHLIDRMIITSQNPSHLRDQTTTTSQSNNHLLKGRGLTTILNPNRIDRENPTSIGLHSSTSSKSLSTPEMNQSLPIPRALITTSPITHINQRKVSQSLTTPSLSPPTPTNH